MKVLRFLFVFFVFGLFFSSCQKDFTYESGTAKGTLQKDATGDCMPVLVNGSYSKDTLLNSSNYAEVQINITQPGTYFIKTDTVNGYSFSASGSSAITGLNTIRLFGSGRPVAGGVDIFHVRFDSTGQSFCEINVVVSGTGGGGGGTGFITAGVNGMIKSFNANLSGLNTTNSGVHTINIAGDSTGGIESIDLSVNTLGTLVTGTSYDVNSLTAFVLGSYTNSGGIMYTATNTGSPQTGPLSVTFSLITPNRVTGSFAGTMRDNAGAGPGTIVFSNGSFDVSF